MNSSTFVVLYTTVVLFLVGLVTLDVLAFISCLTAGAFRKNVDNNYVITLGIVAVAGITLIAMILDMVKMLKM